MVEPAAECVNFEVYNLQSDYFDERLTMPHIGLDIGTRTIVVAFRGGKEKLKFVSEINGFWPFERATKFVENMLNDPQKVRSDGTTRPARWIKLNDQIIVLGKDAEEFAYAKNDTLRRPMAEGGVSHDESAMIVLSSLVHMLLDMAEHELGKFGDKLQICYCTTAKALNKEINIDYHERVVNLILDGYETTAEVTKKAIKESHAIVLDLDEEKGAGDGTGIGISWGAGTVTVSYVKYGMEIYSFCYVGAGDWIDENVAMRHGYDPNSRKKSAETPTTVSKRKMTIDLTPGHVPDDRIGLDISLHYDVLITRVIEGIVQGFKDNEAEARIENAINIYMAGGTSSPKGFTERVKAKLVEQQVPFTVGEVVTSEKPLFSVATGCLKAAEFGIVD